MHRGPRRKNWGEQVAWLIGSVDPGAAGEPVYLLTGDQAAAEFAPDRRDPRLHVHRPLLPTPPRDRATVEGPGLLRGRLPEAAYPGCRAGRRGAA